MYISIKVLPPFLFCDCDVCDDKDACERLMEEV